MRRNIFEIRDFFLMRRRISLFPEADRVYFTARGKNRPKSGSTYFLQRRSKKNTCLRGSCDIRDNCVRAWDRENPNEFYNPNKSTETGLYASNLFFFSTIVKNRNAIEGILSVPSELILKQNFSTWNIKGKKWRSN